jgi:hypothetical protein
MMPGRRTSFRHDPAVARRTRRRVRPMSDAKPSDWKIDEGLKESFPASDPPSWTAVARIGAPRRKGSEPTTELPSDSD